MTRPRLFVEMGEGTYKTTTTTTKIHPHLDLTKNGAGPNLPRITRDSMADKRWGTKKENKKKETKKLELELLFVVVLV